MLFLMPKRAIFQLYQSRRELVKLDEMMDVHFILDQHTYFGFL